MKKAAILAAGEGTRLKTIEKYKPIVKINGIPLIEIIINSLKFKNFDKVSVIFNEYEKDMNIELVPGLLAPNIEYFFKTTPSSMHSLYEVVKKTSLKPGEHLFVSMVDSIIAPSEADKFHQFCELLKEDESAIIVTSYIQDEKPLTLAINSQGYVIDFQCPIKEDTLITSGIYYFSENTIPILIEMITNGNLHMRHFLKELIDRNFKIKAFITNKTIDIDHPQDIKTAENFLQELNIE
ncbi:MAG: sugar phosphate nucleotidyltransferase [Bacteriovorax sp.]|nr:sugar phosphate nucleotidyltransferase [Bacteriovorax sp.]